MKPELLILIGSSGSGKTYFSNKLKNIDNNWVVVASDDFRTVKGFKLGFLKKPFKVFVDADDLIFKELKLGHNVVYDACNLSCFRRMRLIHRLHSIRSDISVIGLVFHTKFSVCVRRDKSMLREYSVGFLCILIMKLIFFLNSPRLNEGFDYLMHPYGFLKARYKI